MAPSTEESSGPTQFSRKYPRVDLIFNEVSGHSDPKDDLDRIKETLNSYFSDVFVWKTTPELDGRDLAQKAIEDGANILIACGGDGTVAAVATAIKVHKMKKGNGSAKPFETVDVSKEQTGDDIATSEGGNHAVDGEESVIEANDTIVPVHQDGKSDSMITTESMILGVIPRGTANALATALEIPSDVSEAARMIADGPLREIDMPTIPKQDENGSTTDSEVPHSMLLQAGIGLEAKCVEHANRSLKSVLGVFAYTYAGWKALFQSSRFSTDVTLHDVHGSLTFADCTASSEKLELKGMRLQGIAVANTAPPTSVLAQGLGEVRPDDGKLEIVCVHGKNALSMIRTVLSLLLSALVKRRTERFNVLGLRARKATITCNPPQTVVVDGELAGKTPITIELNRDQDKMIVIAPNAGVVKQRHRRRSRAIELFLQTAQVVGTVSIAFVLFQRLRSRKDE